MGNTVQYDYTKKGETKEPRLAILSNLMETESGTARFYGRCGT
jgi:hypothetical protein